MQNHVHIEGWIASLGVLEVKHDGFRREIRINTAVYADFCDMWRNFPGQMWKKTTPVRGNFAAITKLALDYRIKAYSPSETIIFTL
jgi:hypothetical protein